MTAPSGGCQWIERFNEPCNRTCRDVFCPKHARVNEHLRSLAGEKLAEAQRFHREARKRGWK